MLRKYLLPQIYSRGSIYINGQGIMYITIYNLYTTSLMDIALDNIQSLQTYQESGLKKKSTLNLLGSISIYFLKDHL